MASSSLIGNQYGFFFPNRQQNQLLPPSSSNWFSFFLHHRLTGSASPSSSNWFSFFLHHRLTGSTFSSIIDNQIDQQNDIFFFSNHTTFVLLLPNRLLPPSTSCSSIAEFRLLNQFLRLLNFDC